jgi:nicotinamidase-related amidase
MRKPSHARQTMLLCGRSFGPWVGARFPALNGHAPVVMDTSAGCSRRLKEIQMPTIDRETSSLLMIDFQSRLMPAIEDGAAVLANARRLIDAAGLMQLPVVFTEQNAEGLGATVPGLRPNTATLAHKMTFDACRMPGFLASIPDRPALVVAGCETHVCVLQSVLGLLAAGRRVYLVRDAVGSRRGESKDTAIRRMERNGAEIVTTEMVVFEWLGTAADHRLRAVIDLIR